MAKTASNQLGICLRIMHVRPVPKVSIFMAVTTKKVTEKAQKWAKMARFWPKTRYNGRVMAREIFFHQCLWVTKFCAKFGRSRIPRTARMHNSLIVLRCMWKEPAPLIILNTFSIALWLYRRGSLYNALCSGLQFTCANITMVLSMRCPDVAIVRFGDITSYRLRNSVFLLSRIPCASLSHG